MKKMPIRYDQPASTQKLLTALIVAETGFLDRPVTVQSVDTMCDPVKLGIKSGETYQRMDLLRALLVKSPNDVARCLARDNAGSVEAFAQMMNRRALQLGAVHSHFVNPNGLPVPGQYSSARDLAIIARAAYANPTIRSIVCLPQLVFRYANGRTRELENTNKLLRRLPYCNGMKTGYTDACGQMPDRKRDASRQRCNRRCAGRQLQPGVARRLRAAFVGPVDVTADDGIRTRDLRFTKPLLYQLSYVGGKRAKHCIQRRFTQARYKGSTNVSPISRSAIRSGVLLSAASKRSIGSRKGSRLSRNVWWCTGTTKRAPAAFAIWTACSGVLCDWIHGLYTLIGTIATSIGPCRRSAAKLSVIAVSPAKIIRRPLRSIKYPLYPR